MKTVAWLMAGVLLADAASAQTAPEIFAPGVVSGPAADADATFTPDGATLVFARGGALLVSRRAGDGWSAPVVAPFSGAWNDQQPTFAPDGGALVFVSNRPVAGADAKTRVAGNLWRVERRGDAWGEPVHLPAAVNRGPSIWGPSVARDGSLYFMDRVDGKGPFKLWRAQAGGGTWQPAVLQALGEADGQQVDPCVAPDESFIVFSAKRAGSDDHERLFIAKRRDGGWGPAVDLGDAVNGRGDSDANEARLGPDGRTLYFASDRQQPLRFPRTAAQADADLARIAAWDDGLQNVWRVSLAAWLDDAKTP